MDAAEVEFLAEQQPVAIIPSFSLDRIYLIGGDLGPFNPGLPVEVPLWLAINLKQRQKCRLIPPEWMDVEKLEQIRDQERKEDTFTPMPSPFYMELTKLLLNYAVDNIPKADEIRTLVKDIWDTRIAKLRLSADSFVRQQEAHARVREIYDAFISHDSQCGVVVKSLTRVIWVLVPTCLETNWVTLGQSQALSPAFLTGLLLWG
uniref:GINS complex subunit 2 n=1 Tax=Varanus komodoensis TaxID=61221 RepID=A0A8D2Q5T8_VARKO